MTEKIRKKLNDSPAARWTMLALVSFTMFCGYFITDVMAPLMELLSEQFKWDAFDYGVFTSAYGWINVFLFMLIIGGMILDKIGGRKTGIVSCVLMIVGCFLKYYAIKHPELFQGEMFGLKMQVLMASLGYAIFGCGIEMAGITVTKVIAKWFKGYEVALAMGLQVSVARLGTTVAISSAIPLSEFFHSISTTILLGLVAICIGLISYCVFCVMDKKLDVSAEGLDSAEEEEPFAIRDIFNIIKNKGFWLVALLCILFYSAIFPFLKYATSLMINKYDVDPKLAGSIPAILTFGAIFFTPLFGYIYDRKGKGATIMIAGSLLLIVVHCLFAAPILNVWWFAAILMILLGVAFAMVPSAMWPSVPKIIPQNQLGTAYGLIFWTQNIGLSGGPLLIGWVLSNYCIIGEKLSEKGEMVPIYDFTVPMLIFASFGVLALLVAFWLKAEDKKKGYGLEKPNIVK